MFRVSSSDGKGSEALCSAGGAVRAAEPPLLIVLRNLGSAGAHGTVRGRWEQHLPRGGSPGSNGAGQAPLAHTACEILPSRGLLFGWPSPQEARRPVPHGSHPGTAFTLTPGASRAPQHRGRPPRGGREGGRRREALGKSDVLCLQLLWLRRQPEPREGRVVREPWHGRPASLPPWGQAAAGEPGGGVRPSALLGSDGGTGRQCPGWTGSRVSLGCVRSTLSPMVLVPLVLGSGWRWGYPSSAHGAQGHWGPACGLLEVGRAADMARGTATLAGHPEPWLL